MPDEIATLQLHERLDAIIARLDANATGQKRLAKKLDVIIMALDGDTGDTAEPETAQGDDA